MESAQPLLHALEDKNVRAGVHRAPHTFATSTTSSLRVSLVISCLVLQNSGLVLVTKYSHRAGALPYSAATAIFSAEVVKLAACIILEWRRTRLLPMSLRDNFKTNFSNVFMVVPASLYVVQNNLTFFAMKGLSPTVFVVCAQLKILSSAFFSLIFLRSTISWRQIVAIVMLMVGVAIVQVGKHRAATPQVSSQAPAFLALLAAVVTSGLAGALLEKAFKNEAGSSIWMKNFFLSVFSLPFALLEAVRQVGRTFDSDLSMFFYGYDNIVLIVVVLQALGGLLTAAVMKYAGVISKCFAVSLSTVLCTIVGVSMGQEESLRTLIFGSAIVNVAVYMYFTSSSI